MGGLMELRREMMMNAPHICTTSGTIVNFYTDTNKKLIVNTSGLSSNTTITRTGTNMLSPNINITSGYYNDSGVLQSSTGTGHTDLIPVLPTHNYTLYLKYSHTMVSARTGIYLWDANKQFIRRITSPISTAGVLFNFMTDATCRFVSFQVLLLTTYPDMLVLEQSKLVRGISTSSEEPYIGGTYPIDQNIKALVGENNVWIDGNTNINVKYYANHLHLPREYEKLPYITADGNQVLRTTYMPAQYDEFHIRFNGVGYGTILSAGAGTYQLIMVGGFSQTGWYYRYFNSTTVSATADYVAGQWYDVDIDSSGTMYTNDKTFTSPYEAPLDGTATDLYLCERRNWSQRYAGNLSEFWIKNNGVYKMYLIPCIRKNDQKVGMYDIISKTFLTSPTGRSDFIAGT